MAVPSSHNEDAHKHRPPKINFFYNDIDKRYFNEDWDEITGIIHMRQQDCAYLGYEFYQKQRSYRSTLATLIQNKQLFEHVNRDILDLNDQGIFKFAKINKNMATVQAFIDSALENEREALKLSHLIANIELRHEHGTELMCNCTVRCNDWQSNRKISYSNPQIGHRPVGHVSDRTKQGQSQAKPAPDNRALPLRITEETVEELKSTKTAFCKTRNCKTLFQDMLNLYHRYLETRFQATTSRNPSIYKIHGSSFAAQKQTLAAGMQFDFRHKRLLLELEHLHSEFFNVASQVKQAKCFTCDEKATFENSSHLARTITHQLSDSIVIETIDFQLKRNPLSTNYRIPSFLDPDY